MQENTPLFSFGFLLLNQFTLISLASAIEPLRMANRIAGEDIYSWATISENSEPVIASDSIALDANYTIQDNIPFDILIVCGGININKNYSKSLLKWLRKVEQQGTAIGSTCTGTHVLAAADLLNGYDCSIHWENINTLKELFPLSNVNSQLYSIDRNRYTCSGGTVPVDMMLYIIGKQNGIELAAAVAEQFVCDRIRRADDPQRTPLQHLAGNHSKKLVLAIQIMEANLEEPIMLSELSGHVGISCRQLERLFDKQLQCTPSKYYLQLRLHHAQKLLRWSNYTILEVSSICGFSSPSHFSRSYKEFFKYPPSQEFDKEEEGNN